MSACNSAHCMGVAFLSDQHKKNALHLTYCLIYDGVLTQFTGEVIKRDLVPCEPVTAPSSFHRNLTAYDIH